MSILKPITDHSHETYKKRLSNLLCTPHYEYYLELVSIMPSQIAFH